MFYIFERINSVRLILRAAFRYHFVILIKNIGSNLIEAIEKLYNSEELYNKLSENAYKEFEKKYSLYVLGKNIGDITEKD